MKKVGINLSNKMHFTLVAIGVLLIIGVGVYALTPGTAPDPGHVVTNIAPPIGCTTGQFLKWDENAWTCVDVDVSGAGSGEGNTYTKEGGCFDGDIILAKRITGNTCNGVVSGCRSTNNNNYQGTQCSIESTNEWINPEINIVTPACNYLQADDSEEDGFCDRTNAICKGSVNYLCKAANPTGEPNIELCKGKKENIVSINENMEILCGTGTATGGVYKQSLGGKATNLNLDTSGSDAGTYELPSGGSHCGGSWKCLNRFYANGCFKDFGDSTTILGAACICDDVTFTFNGVDYTEDIQCACGTSITGIPARPCGWTSSL